ncbi:transcriptional regulator domain-containing protein [Sphingomonas sp. CJ99]
MPISSCAASIVRIAHPRDRRRCFKPPVPLRPAFPVAARALPVPHADLPRLCRNPKAIIGSPGSQTAAMQRCAAALRTMADRPDWRDPGPYARLARIDRAGLMWEWLRRDPGYVAWYSCASKAMDHRSTDLPGLAQWGLHFRRRPGHPGPSSTHRLARGARPVDVAGGRHRGPAG